MSDERSVIRRTVDVNPVDYGTGQAPVGPSSRGSGPQLDDLVDLVVERIEQRVIDELERRGRRPGGL